MKVLFHVPVIIFLLAVGLLAYTSGQSDFGLISTYFTLSFAAYAFFMYKKGESYTFRYLLGVAILARVLLIPSFPLLSDDIYRFYWDAWVYDQGFSPFAYVPNELTYLIDTDATMDVYQSLNSPAYYSVYPPFLQWIFRCAYFLGHSLIGFTIFLKLFILIAEGLTLWFIHQSLKVLHIQKNSLLLYALNPLIIIELSGNAHPEVFMITGLAILIYGMLKLRLAVSAGWGLAIAAKLQPMILFPLLVFHAIKSKQKLLAIISGGLIGCITLLPLFLQPEWFMNFWESIQLYYQTFEFNGSIYKVVRWLGFQITGYNEISTIGPLLSGMATVLIFGIGLLSYGIKENKYRSFLFLAALSWGIYLFFSTTVHPWYLAPLILFCVFVQLESFLLWSYLIIISYISYSYTNTYDPVWLLFIEYLPVFGFLILDIKSFRRDHLQRKFD